MAEVGDTTNEPINGQVLDTEWVSPGELITTVEKDDEIWKESYTFHSAERVD